MPVRPSIAETGREAPQPTLFDTSVEIWRYLLIIRPSARTVHEVARVKKRIAEHIGTFRGEHAVAHITLLYNYLPLAYERDLCDVIRAGVAGHTAFHLSLTGPEHFPDQRSVHLSVVDRQPLVQLRKSIMARSRSYPRLKELAAHATKADRLIIASHLAPGQFEAAMDISRTLTPGRSERITRLWLLRGAQGKPGPYVEVDSFPLAT